MPAPLSASAPDVSSHTWRDELQDLMRGVGGAAIIGMPLIYTMEMWQLATMLLPRTVFLLVLAAIVVNTGYNYASGFRQRSGFVNAILDSIEAYGLGALFSLLLLFLLRIVDLTTPLIDIAVKTAVEAIPLSIGISIANTQFSGSRVGADEESGGSKELERRHPTLVEAGATMAGAILFSFNVAVTEEVIVLATGSTWAHLIAVILFSLALSYGMIFVAEFTGLQKRLKSRGFLQSPFGETLMAYMISIAIATGMIYAFHSLTFSQSPYTTVSAIVILALPATVGGAAGRLIV